METTILSSTADLNKYDDLVAKPVFPNVYYDRTYVELLAERLDAEPCFLGLLDGGSLEAALPAVLQRNDRYGNVINSLPFHGSYGGPVVDPDQTPELNRTVSRELLSAFRSLAVDRDCVFSTVVPSPLSQRRAEHFDLLAPDYRDERVGQYTVLPPSLDDDRRDRLLYDRFSKDCRTAVRRAEREGIETVTVSDPCDEFDQFYDLYQQSMETKGYSGKPTAEGGSLIGRAFVRQLFDRYEPDRCRLRCALLDGEVVGGVLEVRHGEVVDYFQTAIDPEYRNTGATNYLVYEGMCEAVEDGYTYWNFGGTWPSQEGVFKFKRSFGTVDAPYAYAINQYSPADDLLDSTPDELAAEYPGFYVLPYDELDAGA